MIKIGNMTQIGSLIHQTRKEQGLTQEKLAAITGVGVRFLRELEHGKETCEMGRALKIIQSLGIKLYAVQPGEDLS